MNRLMRTHPGRNPEYRPPEYRPMVSIVICTRDRPRQLRECLASLAGLEYRPFDVLVVDNAPSSAAALDVAVRHGARHILDPVPGLSHARNLGARSTESDIIAYLDDDALPAGGWLSALVEEFQDPLVMAVAGCTLPTRDGLREEAAPNSIAGSTLPLAQRTVHDKSTPQWFQRANFGGVGVGNNMAFRRSAFDAWRGFDERLGRGALLDGFEEHHAFFSLLKLGYKVISTPRAIVYHPLPSPQDAAWRSLKDMTNTAAYLTLLFMEEPKYRGLIFRFVVEALGGKGRTWRPKDHARCATTRLPIWKSLKALLRGPWIYQRSTGPRGSLTNR